MPKICSQGYHFSGGVCETGEQRGFISLTHHNELQNSGVQQGGPRAGNTRRPRAPSHSQSHVSSETPIILVWINPPHFERLLFVGIIVCQVPLVAADAPGFRLGQTVGVQTSLSSTHTWLIQ